MSDSHSWCRDTARDEAVRAAEDAAAVERTPLPDHRDLPSAVAELRERVARLEALVGQAAVAGVLDSVGVPPSPATRPGETTAKHPAPPADGLRTERVVLEIVYDPRFWHEPSTWAWKSVLKGRTKTVRVVEETKGGRLPDMVAWITAERDAARAEAERLRDRVAELEAAAKTAALLAEVRESEWRVASELAAEANAENAGGEKQEPWAWTVLGRGIIRAISVSRSDAEDAQSQFACDTTLVPLYAAPPEPRGWLTAEEREAVDSAADAISDRVDAYKGRDGDERRIEVLDALLARSSPPRVKVPERNVITTTAGARDLMWIAAIRAAGGEVE